MKEAAPFAAVFMFVVYFQRIYFELVCIVVFGVCVTYSINTFFCTSFPFNFSFVRFEVDYCRII